MPDKPHASAALQSQMAALQDGYRAKLAEDMAAITAYRPSLEAGDDRDVAAWQALAAVAHRIAGSAGIFGFPEVSRHARILERAIKTQLQDVRADASAPGASLPALAAALLEAWRHEAGTAPSDTTLPAVPVMVRTGDERRRHVLIAGTRDDPARDELADALARQLRPFGYEARVVTGRAFASLAALRDGGAGERPAALLLDLASPETELADGLPGSHGTPGTGEGSDDMPVLVLTERSDIRSRLAAAKAGCAAYLVKPVDAQDVIGWLDDLTGRQPQDFFRVLIVDDDSHLAQTYALALRAAGLQPTVLTEPLRILDLLADSPPDLILMDIYMPECLGIDLARIVRQHRQYVGIPIVFLSVEGDPGRQLAAMQPGGDDFLTKPIAPDHLAKAVLVRARRARALRAVMEKDSLTGLLNHARIKARLATEMARAGRDDQPLAFALIDLDHFKRVNDRHGHLAGDRVLKSLARLLGQRLRRTDIIGRYGGEEFAVILTNTDEAAAATVLREIGRAFAGIRHGEPGDEFQVTLSCGIAGLSAGPPTPEELVAAADRALYAAKAAGRNRVMRAAELVK